MSIAANNRKQNDTACVDNDVITPLQSKFFMLLATFRGVSAANESGLEKLRASESTWALTVSVTDWILVAATESVASCGSCNNE